MRPTVFLFCFLFIFAVLAKKESNDDSLDGDDGILSRYHHLEDHEDLVADEDSHEDKDSSEREPIDPIVICRKNGADQCHCEKNTIDCRKQKRTNSTTPQKPFETAALRTHDPDFEATLIQISGQRIPYLEAKSIFPGQEKFATKLDFTHNQIRLISGKAFDDFVKIRQIRLSHNLLTLTDEYDEWITDKLGKTLKRLDLDHNNIGNLSDGVFDPLGSLKILILDGNPQIRLTDKTFGSELEKLEEISLDYCQLESLPLHLFDNLKSLNAVSLIGNPMASIPAALNTIPGLQILDLSKTNLPEFTPNALKNGHKIEELFLRDMKFVYELDDCAFCGMTALLKIDLSGSSKLKTIHKNAFGFISNKNEATTKLKEFFVTNCKLTTLNEKSLPWGQLESIGISGNPLVCDHNLRWLTLDKELHLFYGKVPTCEGPENLKGTPIQKAEIPADPSDYDSGNSGLSLLFFGATFVVFSALGLGVLYIRRNKSNPFYRPQMPKMGFSNLSAEMDALDNDEEPLGEEAEPRPTEV